MTQDETEKQMYDGLKMASLFLPLIKNGIKTETRRAAGNFVVGNRYSIIEVLGGNTSKFTDVQIEVTHVELNPVANISYNQLVNEGMGPKKDGEDKNEHYTRMFYQFKYLWELFYGKPRWKGKVLIHPAMPFDTSYCIAVKFKLI